VFEAMKTDDEGCDVGRSASRVESWSEDPARHDVQPKMSATGSQTSLKRTGSVPQTQSGYQLCFVNWTILKPLLHAGVRLSKV